MNIRRTYKIDVDCAECARKIEQAISKVEDVDLVAISFVEKKMFIGIDDGKFDTVMKEVDAVAHRVEPDFRYWSVEEPDKEEEEKEGGRWLILRIAIGAVFMLLGLLVEYDVVDTDPYDNQMYIIYFVILLFVGYSTFLAAARNLINAKFLDENFLMSISTLSALAIGYWTESLAIMVFYLIGESLENRAVENTRRNIKNLMGLKVTSATVMREGKAIKVDPADVKVGETVIVGPGETFLDGTVIDGDGFADTRAVTGESVPRHISPGSRVLGGFINTDVTIVVRADRPYNDSTVKRMLDLIEQSSARKTRSEKFITRFARYYTPTVVMCAALLAIVPSLMWPENWSTWIYRAIIFLVVSCPCALVISVPLSYFCGIGGASREGILIKGGSYIEMLSKVDKVVFDKTGTLTKGEFKVSAVDPAEGFTAEEVIDVAACAEAYSSHPIARSICDYCGRATDPSRIQETVNIPGRGVKASVDDRAVFVGSYTLMEDCGVKCQDIENGMGTDIFVAIEGRYAGHILISDSLKEGSKDAIAELRMKGVRSYMLTGDRTSVGKAVAEELGVDDFIAEMLPQDKTRVLEEIMAHPGGSTAFVGDGINDAPSLARADVGIAMGGIGSDAAIEAADVVILNDSPLKVAEARNLSKKTQNIIMQNIVFALAVKISILALTPLGLVNMWMAIFGDVGVLILCIMNSTRAFGHKHKADVPDRKKYKTDSEGSL